MESVTEQLRRSGLIIDEMDNPEQSTNNLTPQQAKIVFDSIPRLMDMDSIMSSNTENPIVFPFVSMCIFSDLFPGEKERKRQVSSEIAHHGRRLMEITIHDLSPRQKGFIINTAFSGLLSSPRLQLDAARDLFENNQDQVNQLMNSAMDLIGIIDFAVEKEFFALLNQSDSESLNSFFRIIFYEMSIVRNWFTPHPLFLMRFIDGMARFNSVLQKIVIEKNALQREFSYLTAHINFMRTALLGLVIQHEPTKVDMIRGLYDSIRKSSTSTIGIIEPHSEPFLFVEHLCNSLTFAMPGLSDIIGLDSTLNDEYLRSTVSQIGYAQNLLENASKGQEVPRIGGGMFSLNTHLSIVGKRIVELIERN